jgi:uncharacterized membrane protein YphA (DoxX/SURF4 family)
VEHTLAAVEVLGKMRLEQEPLAVGMGQLALAQLQELQTLVAEAVVVGLLVRVVAVLVVQALLLFAILAHSAALAEQ